MAKKETRQAKEMPKPKWKIGEVVVVEFIGSKTEVRLTEQLRNPQHIDRWIYRGIEVSTGLKIPYIGVGNTEQWANIYIAPVVEENQEEETN